MNEKLIELLKKVKELADRGVDGEKQSAQAKLHKLLEKHGLTEADIEGDTRTWIKYRYKNTLDRRLMLQIVSNVIGDRTYKVPRKGRYFWLEMSVAERIEFEFKVSVYKRQFNKELEIFYTAFIMTNSIYDHSREGKPWEEFTPEEKEEYQKAQKMSQTIEPAELFKQLKE